VSAYYPRYSESTLCFIQLSIYIFARSFDLINRIFSAFLRQPYNHLLSELSEIKKDQPDHTVLVFEVIGYCMGTFPLRTDFIYFHADYAV